VSTGENIDYKFVGIFVVTGGDCMLAILMAEAHLGSVAPLDNVLRYTAYCTES